MAVSADPSVPVQASGQHEAPDLQSQIDALRSKVEREALALAELDTQLFNLQVPAAGSTTADTYRQIKNEDRRLELQWLQHLSQHSRLKLALVALKHPSEPQSTAQAAESQVAGSTNELPQDTQDTIPAPKLAEPNDEVVHAINVEEREYEHVGGQADNAQSSTVIMSNDEPAVQIAQPHCEWWRWGKAARSQQDKRLTKPLLDGYKLKQS